MPITARELVTKWGFDVDLKPVRQMLQDVFFGKEALKTFGDIVKEASDLTFGLAKGAGEYGKELEDTSDLLNIHVDDLQAWQVEARKVGIENDRLTMALTHLQRMMLEAVQEPGGKAAQIFAHLGKLIGADGPIYIDKYTGGLKNMNEMLLTLSDVFPKLNRNARAAYASDLLGRVFRLTEVFKGGRVEMEKTLATDKARLMIGNREVETQSRFNDRLVEFSALLTQIKTKIGTELIPVFSDIINQFTAFISKPEGRRFLTKELPDALRGMVDAVRSLVPLLKALNSLFASGSALSYIMGGKPSGAIARPTGGGLIAGPFQDLTELRNRYQARAQQIIHFEQVNHPEFHLHGTADEMLNQIRAEAEKINTEDARRLLQQLHEIGY